MTAMHVICVNLLGLLALVGVTLIDAYCIQGPHSHITSEGNLACEYEGHVLEMETNKVLEDKCMRCSCSDVGLSCCGMGTKAGVFAIDLPENCHIINCKCHAVRVKKSDNMTDCFSDSVLEICRQEYGSVDLGSSAVEINNIDSSDISYSGET